MPTVPEKVEIGLLADLVVVPVGWLKARAAITGGVRDIEVIVRGGVRPGDIPERLGSGERISVALAREDVGAIAASSHAWLVVENGLVSITNIPVEAVESDSHPQGGSPSRKHEDPTGSAAFEPLPAVYGGGLVGHIGSRSEWEQAFVHREMWWLELAPDEIRVWRAPGSVKAERELMRSESWDRVQSVSFQEGGTSSNIAALATFGLLGLGARKSWSVITVRFSNETAVFVVYRPLHQMEPVHGALIREGVATGKMVFGVTLSTGRDPEVEALPEGLERLAAMYLEGILTDEEFASAKKRLIEGG